MAVQWSGSAPELVLSIDRDATVRAPFPAGGSAARAIRSGRLASGERLPSSRQLAADLGLSRGLVQDCYAQLQAEGYLTSSPGSATRVAAGAETRPRTTRGHPPRRGLSSRSPTSARACRT